MATSPIGLESFRKGAFFGGPAASAMSAENIEMVAQPIFKKVGEIKPPSTCIPSAQYFHPVADASNLARNTFSTLVGGASALGETSPLYGPIGVGWAYDNWKQIRANKRIGDEEGVGIEQRKFVENVSLAVGSVGMEGLRAIGMVTEISDAMKSTATLSTTAAGLQVFFNWFSTIFFGIYYALFAYRLGEGLVHLSRGKDLRAELLKAKDPIEALNKLTQSECDKLRNLSTEALENIAIEEGALWLEKVAKEAKKKGIPVTWDESENGRKLLARALLEAHPEYMMAEMGASPFSGPFEVNEMARFGEFMAGKRLCAKLDAGYSRLLGADAVAAAKSGDQAQFKALLENPSWKKEAIKLAITLIGLAATIAGGVLTGGAGLAVLLILYGITGLVWIIVCDGQAFKEQWDSGQVKKRDKWLIAISVVLSIAALGGLIALSVISGGATFYLIGLIITTAWLITNTRALVALIQRERRPWDYANIPTPEMFRKLIESRPTAEKVEEILKKMSDYNQQNIRTLLKTERNWYKVALVWEQESKKREEAAIRLVVEQIEKIQLAAV